MIDQKVIYDTRQLATLIDEAHKHFEDNKRFFTILKKLKKDKIDALFHQFHDDVFTQIDCLKCANCCKTTSPRIFSMDVERMSKACRMSSREFMNLYVSVDEDDDMVFKSQPCPFLDAENYCSIYKSRPLACREYPHTNRKKMIPVLEITLQNTLICPAVFLIVMRIKAQIK